MNNVYEQVDKNKLKSTIVMVSFMGFIAFVAWIYGQATDMGASFVGIALVISGIMSFGSYYYSDKIVLSLSGAKPANRQDNFDFYTVTENLCIGAQLPMPKLYVIPDTAMNAFATGRDPKHAAVVATTGLLQRLDRSELEGVVAHELSHVGNYDIRLMSIVTILVGTVTLLADWFLRMSWSGRKSKNSEGGSGIIAIIAIVLTLLSPIIAQLIQLAISRQREYLADASAAKLTRQPSALASALRKLSTDTEPLEAANKATAHLYITNPLKNRKDTVSWFAGMFATHPPIEKRIQVLESMM